MNQNFNPQPKAPKMPKDRVGKEYAETCACCGLPDPKSNPYCLCKPSKDDDDLIAEWF